MKAIIYPSTPKVHSIMIPPSKSMAHRAILCASLANGTSHISNLDYSVDIRTTIEGMRQLGAEIKEEGNCLTIKGIGGFDCLNSSVIECNESGSTLRFFIPIFSLTKQRIRFTGKNRLLKRPQKIYQDLFKEQGNHYFQTEEYIEIEGAIQPGEIVLRGDVSSQFISGLLFSLPMCQRDSVLKIIPPFESRSYVLLTIQMLEKFNVKVSFIDENTIFIPGNQHYYPADVRVEGDYSQLGFFAALGSLNDDLNCLGLDHESLQGDCAILSILQSMNGKISKIQNGWRFEKSELKKAEIDLSDCPDLGPILMVLASFAKGTTTIFNAARLRLKESDRIAAMESELCKVGVSIQSTEDTVKIKGRNQWNGNVTVSGHKDHRIVMAMAIGATMADGPVIITEAESISKSYPGFFEDLEKLGIHVEEMV